MELLSGISGALKSFGTTIYSYIPSNNGSEAHQNGQQSRNNRPRGRADLASNLDASVSHPIDINDCACVKCKSLLDNPRRLNCGHRVCLACAESLWDINTATSLVCPKSSCFALTYVQQGNLDSLPREQFIVDLVESARPRLGEIEKSSMGGSLQNIMVDPASKIEVVDDELSDFVLLEASTDMTASQAVDRGINSYLPFAFSKAQADEKVKAWLAGLYFAPADLMQNIVIRDAEAFCVPFYLFDVTTNSTCSAKRPLPPVASSSSSSAESLEPVEEAPTFENIEEHMSYRYHDILTCASWRLNPELLRPLIQPPPKTSLFPSSELREFQSDEVSKMGKMLTVDLPASKAWLCKQDTFSAVTEPERCRDELKKKFGDKLEDIDIAVDFRIKDTKLFLLPFYYVLFTYAGEHEYEILLSGWDAGRVSGTRPYGFGTAGRMVNAVVGAVKHQIEPK